MRFFSPKRLWLALVLLSVATAGARGQWKIVAPNLTQVANGKGAMSFNSGMLWIAASDLFISTDSGKTWTSKSLPFPNLYYYDIEFMNATEGVLSSNDETWTTSDGGTTWQILTPTGANSACFLNSDKAIAIADHDNSLGITTDGGNTWENFPPQQVQNCVRYKNGRVYEFGGGPAGGFMVTSTDFGLTWQQGNTGIDFDSFSFAIDSCDPNRIYLSHEDAEHQTDQFSKIYITTDTGDTWQTTFKQPQPFLSGSVAEGYSAIYCQSVAQGIFRSTDRGMTWSSIGGPSAPWDTRLIAAINDNIVVGVDNNGNVWRTDNSGGDSVLASSLPSSFSAYPDTVFATDTIQCDSIARTISFTSTGCSQLASVVEWKITGPDSASYKASNLSDDSISVTLYGMNEGNQHAQLIFNLDNGSSDTVLLAGYVKFNSAALTLLTNNVQTDTLGATVSVPITLNGLEHAENIDLILHYDGPVDYLGSFSPSGMQLDVPGEQRAGWSELSVTGVTSGAILGYAKFNVFNDSNEASIVDDAAHATFDSVNVLTQTSACEYSMPAPVTSTITTLSGCAIPILSQLIHFGVEPQLSIVPNPANGNVWISSSGDVGAVTIEVFDMLGTEQSVVSGHINENEPMELLLPARSGVYNILVHSVVGTRTLRVVREN